MYKYTPKKSIVRNLRKIQTGRHIRNREWDFCRSYFAMQNNYTDTFTMMKYFCDFTAFYSLAPVKFVPVMSSMFPVDMFEVEIS